MPDRTFDLVETISDLLKRSREGRQNLNAQSAVFEDFSSAVVRREQACKVWYELVRIPLPEEKPALAKAKRERKRRKSEYERLYEETSALWLKQGEVTAFIGQFANDVAVLSDRLPAEWDFYHRALRRLRVGDLGAWADPPTSPDLETLELRLRKMLDLAVESQPVKTSPDLGQRSQREPDLETSRERIPLPDSLRAELTTDVLEQGTAITSVEIVRDREVKGAGPLDSAAGEAPESFSGGDLAGVPEDRLSRFKQRHPGTTLADIKHSANVHTAEFQDWRRGKLKPDSVMSKRIEDVLSGATPLKKNPPKPRPK
jgi:hypothetical protein